MVIVEVQTVELNYRGMYAQCSPLLESEMLGRCQIETRQVIGVLATLSKAMLLPPELSWLPGLFTPNTICGVHRLNQASFHALSRTSITAAIDVMVYHTSTNHNSFVFLHLSGGA